MKVGRIPVASIILLIFSFISLVVNFFFPASRQSITPCLNGGMIGAMLVIGVFYANIYIGAWMNNRKNSSLQV